MGTSSGSISLRLEEHLNNAVSDAPDIVYRLSQLQHKEDSPIEIVSELPAAVDVDIILGYIARWHDVQEYFNRDLRIYAWSYNTTVEKYILGCVQQMSRIYVTILPAWLREDFAYDE